MGTFCGDEKVLELDGNDGCTFECTKCQWIVHVKNSLINF